MSRKLLSGLVFVLGLILGPVAGLFVGRLFGEFAFGSGIITCGLIWTGALKLSHELSPPKHDVPPDLPDRWRDKDWDSPDEPPEPGS